MADSEDRLEGVPEMPEGKIPIQAPPNQAEAAGIGNVLAMVVPMMGSMGVMVFMAISQASGGAGQGRNSMMLMMAGGMVFAMVAMVAFNVYRQVSQHRQKVRTLRGEYLAYLSHTTRTCGQGVRSPRGVKPGRSVTSEPRRSSRSMSSVTTMRAGPTASDSTVEPA